MLQQLLKYPLLLLSLSFVTVNTVAQKTGNATYKSIVYTKGVKKGKINIGDYTEIRDKSYNLKAGKVVAITEKGIDLGRGIILYDRIEKIKIVNVRRKKIGYAIVGASSIGFLGSFFVGTYSLSETGQFHPVAIALFLSSCAVATTGFIITAHGNIKPAKGWEYELLK